jgi:hypothetical protein
MIEWAATIVMIAISALLCAYWLREALYLILAKKPAKPQLRYESSSREAA